LFRPNRIKTEPGDRTTEERVSRPDSEGKLGDISRTVSKESESSSGEKRDTVETYSVDLPGSTRDSSLHLVDRATTVQHTSLTGDQTTEQQVEHQRSGFRFASDHTNYRHGAPRPFRSERQFWSSLRGHHKVRQRSRRSGSDSAFRKAEIS